MDKPETPEKSQLIKQSAGPNVSRLDENANVVERGASMQEIANYVVSKGPDVRPTQSPKSRQKEPKYDNPSHTTIPRPSLIDVKDVTKKMSDELPPIRMKPFTYQPQGRKESFAPAVPVQPRNVAPPPQRDYYLHGVSDGIETDEVSGGMTSDEPANPKASEEEGFSWFVSSSETVKREDVKESTGYSSSASRKNSSPPTAKSEQERRKSVKSSSSRKPPEVHNKVSIITDDEDLYSSDGRPIHARGRETFVALPPENESSSSSSGSESGSRKPSEVHSKASKMSDTSSDDGDLYSSDGRPIHARGREMLVALSPENQRSSSSSGSESGSRKPSEVPSKALKMSDTSSDDEDLYSSDGRPIHARGRETFVALSPDNQRSSSSLGSESSSSSGSIDEGETEHETETETMMPAPHVPSTSDSDSQMSCIPSCVKITHREAKARNKQLENCYLVQPKPNCMRNLCATKCPHYPVIGTRLSVGTIFPNCRRWHIIPAARNIERGRTDYVFKNAMNVMRTPARIPIPRYVDDIKGRTHLFCKSGLAKCYVNKPDYGRVPSYIRQRLAKLECDMRRQAQRRAKIKCQGKTTEGQSLEMEDLLLDYADCVSDYCKQFKCGPRRFARRNCERYSSPKDNSNSECEEEESEDFDACEGTSKDFPDSQEEDNGIDLDALEPLEHQRPQDDDVGIDLDKLAPLEESLKNVSLDIDLDELEPLEEGFESSGIHEDLSSIDLDELEPLEGQASLDSVFYSAVKSSSEYDDE